MDTKKFELTPEELSTLPGYDLKTVSQAIVATNQSKGQLYRMKPIVDSKEPEPILMCLFYDPLVPNSCWRGYYASLKCHSERTDCLDYKPSHSRIGNIQDKEETK